MVIFFTEQIEQKGQSFTTGLTFHQSCCVKNDFKTLKPGVYGQLNDVINGIV